MGHSKPGRGFIRNRAAFHNIDETGGGRGRAGFIDVSGETTQSRRRDGTAGAVLENKEQTLGLQDALEVLDGI